MKLVKSLDFFDPRARATTAVAASRCLALKLGVQPDILFGGLFNDRVVAQGAALEWATAVFADYLASEPADELLALLRKARTRRVSQGFGGRPCSHKDVALGFAPTSTFCPPTPPPAFRLPQSAPRSPLNWFVPKLEIKDLFYKVSKDWKSREIIVTK